MARSAEQIMAENLAKKSGKEFETICTVGYTGGVNPYDEERRAHGGVTLCQAIVLGAGKIVGRKVCSNGRHREVGAPFFMTIEELTQWRKIEAERR